MMRRTAAAAILAAIFLSLGVQPVAAQEESDKIQILAVDLEESPLVELTVAIPPALGEVPANSDFFAVTESGVRRSVEVRSLRDAVDVAVVIDTSGSMRGAAMSAAKAAAIDFVRSLPDAARVAVIGFGAEPVVTAPLGSGRTEVEAAITGLASAGETALWQALEVASSVLADSGAEQPYVVVLSDGGNTVEGATLASAVDALKAVGAPLYAVALQTSESNESELTEAVALAGGVFLTTQSTNELSALYTEIAGRLANRYAVRFTSAGTGDQAVVLTVAVGETIALARTNLVFESSEIVEATEAPAALSTAAIPAELGTVIGPDPTLFSQAWMLWVGVGATFVALFAIASSFSMPRMQVRSLGGSVRETGSRMGGMRDSLTRGADQMVSRRDKEGEFDLALDSAGLNLRPGEFMVLVGVSAVVAGLFGSIAAGALAGFVLAMIVGFGALAFVRIKRSRRRAAFSDQLTDTITILTGSLRSGRGFPQALELVAQEAQRPTSDEFRRVVVESRVGRDQVESLMSLGRRMDNPDMSWISQAVAINRELGGDLVEVLENVAETIRSRTRVKRQVRALSAEGRISGWLMVSMPFIMFAYMRAINPEYVEPLTSTTGGLTAIGVGLILIVMGTFWIRKLVDMKY